MMSPDDLSVMIGFAFVAYAFYAGMKHIAEAIDAFSRKNVEVTIRPLTVVHHHHTVQD